MTRSLKTGITVVTAGLLALVAGFATYHLAGGPGFLSGSSMLSDDADVASLFATRLPDVNGKETPLADIAGRVTIVNFWATWCTPCREEIPDFVRLQAEYADRGVRFVGIAAERVDKVPAFVREFGINYPILIGEFAAIELSRKLGDKAGALPYTIVLDADRKVVHRQLGVLSPAKLRDILAKLL